MLVLDSLNGITGVLRELTGASQVAQWFKKKKNIHLLKQETQVPPLHQEDPVEKKMATHCSILAWEIPRTEEPGR